MSSVTTRLFHNNGDNINSPLPAQIVGALDQGFNFVYNIRNFGDLIGLEHHYFHVIVV